MFAEGPGFTRVSVSGELDLATAPELADALAEAPAGAAVVILDLSQLTFIDSTGLHMILAARARLAEADCRLVLIPGAHQVQRIFEITATNNTSTSLAHQTSPTSRSSARGECDTVVIRRDA